MRQVPIEAFLALGQDLMAAGAEEGEAADERVQIAHKLLMDQVRRDTSLLLQ